MDKHEHLSHMRRSYTGREFRSQDLCPNPYDQFKVWFNEASSAGVSEPNAMTLGTVNEDNQPSVRTVLLKEIREDGFVFFTNYGSSKANDIKYSNKVALLFYWKLLMRQIRIEGVAKKIDEVTSISYFQSRPRGSQIGAWASPQSQVIANRQDLEDRAQSIKEKFSDYSVLPKPSDWGGYVVKPHHFEFWQGQENRLHDRLAYNLDPDTGKWSIHRLAP